MIFVSLTGSVQIIIYKYEGERDFWLDKGGNQAENSTCNGLFDYTKKTCRNFLSSTHSGTIPPTKTSSESPIKMPTKAPTYAPSAIPTKKALKTSEPTRMATKTTTIKDTSTQKVAPKPKPNPKQSNVKSAQSDRKSAQSKSAQLDEKSVVAYIIADMPYSFAERSTLRSYIHRMNDRYNRDKARFLIHLGDITGSKTCPESVYEDIDSILSKSKLPVLITPGGAFDTVCSEII
jgi:hypothetical protein